MRPEETVEAANERIAKMAITAPVAQAALDKVRARRRDAGKPRPERRKQAEQGPGTISADQAAQMERLHEWVLQTRIQEDKAIAERISAECVWRDFIKTLTRKGEPAK